MVQRWLITYASRAYAYSAEALRHSGLLVGGFDRVIVYDEAAYPMPTTGRVDFAWKAHLLQKTRTEHCRPGDWLVWADAAMIFQQHLFEHLTLTNDVNLFGIGDAVERGYTTRSYTKPDCLAKMEVTDGEGELHQVNAAIQVYRVGGDADRFISAYVHWCADPECVAHDDAFPNHRHDQSILTILAHREACATIHADVTQWGAQSPVTLLHHRKAFGEMPTTVVVTPTTGAATLSRCMDSVQGQRVVCLRHLVVCDGPDATRRTLHLRPRYAHRVPVIWLDLPECTGRDRWNGHRIYGASAFLASAAHACRPAEFLAFLDEDNWLHDLHLHALFGRMLDDRLDAVHSLRTIWHSDGRRCCNDDCESLGVLAPSAVGGYFLADTSSWLLTHRVAVETCQCWDVRARDPDKAEADRALTRAIMCNSAWKTGCVARHSLQYTAGSGALSVQPEYFLRANRINRWTFDSRPTLYLFHMSREKTREYLATRFDTSRSYMLQEWNMGQCRALDAHFNVVDGFACLPNIPPNSLTLTSMCHPSALPLDFFSGRTDLKRVLYTAEGPNIRHQQQWNTAFLATQADHVITYWRDLLEAVTPFQTHQMRHNCHHLDESNAHDLEQLRVNKGARGSVCIVLENRTGSHEYTINGVRLQCLDSMREELAHRVGSRPGIHLTVHGRGWSCHPDWQMGGCLGKYADPHHAVDIMQNHRAALIVENCNARGYVSEKVYDALLAGAVPIFCGGPGLEVPQECCFDMARVAVEDITADAIDAKREAVSRLRLGVLQTVGARKFADVLVQIHSLAAE